MDIQSLMPRTTASPPAKPDELRQIAEKLEQAFLSEMLKTSGLKEPSSFGGGVGEDQFQSFLRDEQAELITQGGGIGLAESIFQALSRRNAGGGA